MSDQFQHARDYLLQRRTDYETAYREFAWPQLDTFNWALDHFDVVARNNDRPALWIVEEDGSEVRRTFTEMSARSNGVANGKRQDWERNQAVARVSLPWPLPGRA